MKIVPKLDTGPVMMKSKMKIDEKCPILILSNKMSNLSSKMILDALKLIEKKKQNFVLKMMLTQLMQIKLKKKEAKINWCEEAKIILAKINAFKS